MNARLRLAACAVFAAVAVGTTGCGALPFFGTPSAPPSTPAPGASTSATGSVPVTSTPAPTSTPVVNTFAPEPAPKSSDPVLTSGKWGYHEPIDYSEDDETDDFHSELVQEERYELIKEQHKSLLSALKKSSGVKELVRSAGGETDDIEYSVVYVDAAFEQVGVRTPWVTSLLRASFPTTKGLKAVDVAVYRLKTAKGLSNTPFVSGTTVGYVQTDGTIENPTHPKFPR